MVKELEFGGGGGGSGNDGSNIPSLVIGRVHKLVQGSFFDDLIITRI